MKTRRVLSGLSVVCIVCLGLLPVPVLATSGTFKGTVIDPPAGTVSAKILYVKSNNGMVRKVDISGAVVVYEGSYPEAKREKKPAAALKSGITVRITAEQGKTGDWKATQVEIVVPQDEQKPVDRESPIDDRTAVT